MSTALAQTEQKHVKVKVMRHGGGSDAVYGIGLIGAWVYYLRRATTFREGVAGFFKGLVWPAFLVYELLVFLKRSDQPRQMLYTAANRLWPVSNSANIGAWTAHDPGQSCLT